MNSKNLNTGFYFDGTSRDPKLNYVIVFAEGGFRDCFHPRINCLSPETQARRVVPLSSNHRKYFDREELGGWIEEQIARHPELEKMIRGGSERPVFDTN
jgi:hypothetical protein